MMEKFLWLLNIEKEFKGFTYVFYVKEINSAQDDDLKTMMIQIATESNKLIKKNQKLTITKMEEQQQTITKMKELIKELMTEQQEKNQQQTITKIEELMMKQEKKFQPLLDFMNLQMVTD